METISKLKKNWILTPAGFAKLLAAFSSDDERAGAEYEAARERLIKMFRWRGVSEAEEAADETLNRVARRLEEGENIENFSAFIGGVARLVFLETLKQKKSVPIEDVAPEIFAQKPEDVPESDSRLQCFNRCLNELPDETRELIVAYYDADAGGAKIENRKRLAEKLQLEMNALRNRALRVRDRLEKCIKNCMKNQK